MKKFRGSRRLTLGEDFSVGLSCVLIGFQRVLPFAGVDEFLLLGPALVHALEAPFGATTGGSDGLIVDEDEDGICVGGGEDA